MNEAHFHLAVNHLPIIIPGIAAIILAGGFIFSSQVVKRTAYCIFILGAMATFLAMTSGEGAEHIVTQLGADRHLIHEHEEVAERFAICSHILGLLCLFGLWANLNRKKYANTIAVLILVTGIVVLFFGRQAGTTGGEIMHKEIRAGFKIME